MGRSILQLEPSSIRYTQDSIKNTFTKPDANEGKFIGETLDELCEGTCVVEDIDTMEVFEKDGLWWSADNRRLWVFREYERLGGCKTIPVMQISSNRVDPRKFTTDNGGSDIRVRGYRGDPGGFWHRKPNGFLSRKSKRSQPVADKVGLQRSHHQSYISSDSSYNSHFSNYGNPAETFRSSGHVVERPQPYASPIVTPIRTPTSLSSYKGPVHSPAANTRYQNDYNNARMTTTPASTLPPIRTPVARPQPADHTIILGLPDDSRPSKSSKKGCCVIS